MKIGCTNFVCIEQIYSFCKLLTNVFHTIIVCNFFIVIVHAFSFIFLTVNVHTVTFTVCKVTFIVYTVTFIGGCRGGRRKKCRSKLHDNESRLIQGVLMITKMMTKSP